MLVGRRLLRTVLIAGSTLGLTAGGSVLAVASGPAAQAATACAAAWSSTAVYTAGNQASENGTHDKAEAVESGAVDERMGKKKYAQKTATGTQQEINGSG